MKYRKTEHSLVLLQSAMILTINGFTASGNSSPPDRRRLQLQHYLEKIGNPVNNGPDTGINGDHPIPLRNARHADRRKRFEITPKAITFIVMPGQNTAGSNYTTTFVAADFHIQGGAAAMGEAGG